MPRRLALSFLLLFAAAASAQDQNAWTLVSADFQARPVNLLSIGNTGITVTDASGAPPKAVAWSDLLELDQAASASAPPARQPFNLYLNGGDCVQGSPISITDDTLIWQQSLLGRISLSEDRINAIVRDGQNIPALDQSRNADVLHLVNGDVLTGIVEKLDADGVGFRPAGADSDVQIGLDKVAAILLADPDPTAGPTGQALRLRLIDGSSITVASALSDADRLHVGLGDKADHFIDLSALLSIEQLGGPVRWLTSLSPQEVIYHPYFTEDFPPRFDHPVADSAISIRDKFPAFHHGIGVHSYTKLTYAVPPGFAAFRTQFAVDRIPGSDMTRADLTVRLLTDGQVTAEYKHVHFGSIAAPVTVDVSNAKMLSLEVDYGDNLNAQGRFVWLDPAFVRSNRAQ